MKEMIMWACSGFGSVGASLWGVVEKAGTAVSGAVVDVWNSTVLPAFTHVYGVFCNQYMIEGLGSMLASLLFVCLLIWAFKKVWKLDAMVLDPNNLNNRKTIRAWKFTALVVISILGLATAIMFFSGFTDNLSKVLNPEYHALRDAWRLYSPPPPIQ